MNHPLSTQQWVNLCHQLSSTARTAQKYLERKMKEQEAIEKQIKELNKDKIAAQIKEPLESEEAEESVKDLNRHVRHLIRSHGRAAVREAFNTNFPS